MTLTLKRCLSDYIVEILKPARADTKRAGYAGDRLMEFFGADRELATIGRKDGRDYRAKRLRDGVTDSTIRREMGVLMRAWRHAAEEERIDIVPVMKLPPEGQKRERWFSEDEVVALMEQDMSERCRNFLYLAIGTGARKTAILTLPVKRCLGLTTSEPIIDFRDPKMPVTKKRRVRIKIADWLLPRLKVMCAGKKPDDLVIGTNGPDNVYREVKRHLKAVGIDEHGVACHSFRRTFIMWALMNGAKLVEVAAAVGDTVATMEKNYIATTAQQSQGAISVIPNPERNS